MMESASVGAVISQTADFEEPLSLVGGGELKNWRLSYETYGAPNADRSNAVLVCHALSGSQHAAGWYAEERHNIGWWDNLIGPGKPLDTDYFYIISPNNLGGCHGSTGPSSPHPDDGRPYGSRFPKVTVEDWVQSQKLLADKLGITEFAAVVGGSLGGMQALRWAISYPDNIRAAIIIAAAAKLTATNIGFNDIARQAIMRDTDFCGGDYYESGRYPHRGLGVARMLAHMTYLSDAHMAARFGREKRAHTEMFQVESYLRHQGQKFSNSFDANTYLLMTRALDDFDPAADVGGELSLALSPIMAELLLISFSSDWRFSPECSRELTRALLRAQKKASYIEIESQQGHDSFLLSGKTYHAAVRAFMERRHAS